MRDSTESVYVIIINIITASFSFHPHIWVRLNIQYSVVGTMQITE